MDKEVYHLFLNAKKSNDFNLMQDLYNTENETLIKFEYSKMLIRRNRIMEAREILLTLNSDKYARFELGKLEKKLKNYDKAREYFKNIIASTNDLFAKFELGKLEKELGNYELAKMYFEDILKEKNDLHSKFELGKLEFELENYENARNYFNDILKEQDDSHTKLELGKLEKKLGNYQKAKGYFEDILKINYDKYALLELGKLEKDLGNYDSARNYFNKLLATNNSSYARLELAILEKDLGNIKESIRYFKSLLNSKDHLYASINLSILECELGNFNESKKYLEGIVNSLINNTEKEEDIGKLITPIRLLIVLNIKENNLLEALKYVNIALKYKIEISLNVILYLSTKLNIFVKDITYGDMSYDKYQYMDYDEYIAIDHIAYRHESEFSKKIDVHLLFSKIKPFLTKKYKIEKLQMNDKYVIPLKKCGKNGECYVKVITLPNSKEILTMYPIDKCLGESKYDSEDTIQIKRLKN